MHHIAYFLKSIVRNNTSMLLVNHSLGLTPIASSFDILDQLVYQILKTSSLFLCKGRVFIKGDSLSQSRQGGRTVS